MSRQRFFMTTIGRKITVVSVESLSPQNSNYGTAFGSLSLPSTVDIILSDSTIENVSVTWDPGDYDGNTPGTYTLIGTLSVPSGVLNPGGLVAFIEVVVLVQTGLEFLQSLSHMYYDFTNLVGSHGSNISNGNAGLNDLGPNGHTATIVGTPKIRTITVNGNSVNTLEDTSTNAINTGTPANSYLNQSFEIWMLLDTTDGLAASDTVNLLGGTQGTPEGLNVYLYNVSGGTSGRLEIFYGTDGGTITWRSTNAFFADNANPLTLLRIRVDFGLDVITVWKNGQNVTTNEYQDMIGRTVAGSIVTGTMSTINPATYNCTSNIYIGTRWNGSGVLTNVNTNGIAKMALTPLLTDYQAVKVAESFLNLFPYLHTSMRFPSSIDSISDLYLRTCFSTTTSQPLLVLMAGWDQDPSHIDDAVFVRYKDMGYFVISVGMRGRIGASGSRDASARELYDIFDAMQAVRLLYGSRITAADPVFVGFSGGGGNGLGMAIKFPDLFKSIVANFPISDYGYNATYGWWAQESTRRTALEAAIGNTPTLAPNEYKSRSAVLGIGKNLKSYLYLFHDADDPDVHADHSTRVADALDTAGKTNYEISITTSSDSPRWTHSLPNAGAAIIDAEAFWDDEAKTNFNEGLGVSGELMVMGFLKTKHFTLWLGNGVTADGKDRVASLQYNFATNSYTLTPLLDSPATDMTYAFIDVQGRTSSGTISTATLFNPA